MDGAHDLGGKQGYGPVLREEDEPPFHEPWEGRVHGINLSSDVGPAFRYSIERMGAIEYLTTSYYEHWLSSMELNGVESGVFTRRELDDAAARIAAGGDVPQRFDPDAVAAARLRITPHDEPALICGDDQIALDCRCWGAGNDQTTVWRLRERRDGALDLARIAHFDRTQLHP